MIIFVIYGAISLLIGWVAGLLTAKRAFRNQIYELSLRNAGLAYRLSVYQQREHERIQYETEDQLGLH